MPDIYNIIIENCNSVVQGNVSLVKGSLNIKYGPNGSGKSTIAKAIVSQIRNDDTLRALTPFKFLGKEDQPTPTVHGVESLQTALVFDETYVNQFVFQADEVVRDSFDIFIKTAEYEQITSEIETLLSGISSSFAANEEIDQILKDLQDLSDAFGTPTKAGGIPKSSKAAKAFGSGNKIENVPAILEPYGVFIRSSEASKWIGWQIKGKEFLEMGDTCPYCSISLEHPDQKQTILAVEKEYDSVSINHLNAIKAIVERLGEYFSGPCRDQLHKITSSKTAMGNVEEQFLSQLQANIGLLIERLKRLRTLSFFAFRDVTQVSDLVAESRIDLALIDKLDSAKTRDIIDPLNGQIDALLGEIGALTGCVNKQKAKIAKTIQENQDSINHFLRSAGYRYSVAIVPEGDSYKMKLRHQDHSDHIETATQHLSYGERNAFALVLFMYQVASESPDLVILDDPISSFDKNKKFAILNELFRGKASLQNSTCLMLTHDIEPAIDIVRGIPKTFQGANPSVTYLNCNKGKVSEIPITRDDIQTFAQICKANIIDIDDVLVKSIYLRRHYEIVDNKGLEYNLLSSLFHKRTIPTISPDNREMSQDEIQKAVQSIRQSIAEFNYEDLIKETEDDSRLLEKFEQTDVGYEKLQLFRLISAEHSSEVVTKFINESYHIENEYVMQLNPHKFECVPEYVIEECARSLREAGKA